MNLLRVGKGVNLFESELTKIRRVYHERTSASVQTRRRFARAVKTIAKTSLFNIMLTSKIADFGAISVKRTRPSVDF